MSGKVPAGRSNDLAGQTGPDTVRRPDISAFAEALRNVRPGTVSGMGTPSGRVLFGLDATFSRQPTWDLAISLQADMFNSAAAVGGIETQLVYFRGTNECKASGWEREPGELARKMSRIAVQGGRTQIARVLDHASAQNAAKRLAALVFIGDAVEEPVDDLCARAGELGLAGVKGFFFHEGGDGHARSTFMEMARLMNGAAFQFDAGSAERLRHLLAAIAVWAAGGNAALRALAASESRGSDKAEGARNLLRHISGGQ